MAEMACGATAGWGINVRAAEAITPLPLKVSATEAIIHFCTQLINYQPQNGTFAQRNRALLASSPLGWIVSGRLVHCASPVGKTRTAEVL
jgi:hypothetical protein